MRAVNSVFAIKVAAYIFRLANAEPEGDRAKFILRFRVWGVEFGVSGFCSENACLWHYEDDVYCGLNKVEMLLVACLSYGESLQHQDMSGLQVLSQSLSASFRFFCR